MSVKSNEVANVIRRAAPEYLAESWDNVGMQIGSRDKVVEKVLLTLDVTEEVVDEAVEGGFDMIISHHPFIFQGLRKIDTDDFKGKMVKKLLAHDICVYAAHTNLDKAELGLNDYIARRFELDERSILKPDLDTRLYKIVVYVPTDYTDRILKVLGDGGAGFTGERYSHCSFRVRGTGSFKPLEGAHPFIGEPGEVVTVQEDRVETIVDGRILKDLFPKLQEAHPYEDMAYDLYPVEQAEICAKSGLGKIGMLEKEMTPDEFIEHTKKVLNVRHLRTAGIAPEKISRVALCTGSGAEFIGLAKVRNADVFVTGDLKYHDAQRALENGMWVIDAGHFGTEKQVVNLLEEMIREGLPENSVQTEVSSRNEDFFKNY